MKKDELLDKIKQTVLGIEPDAGVLFYGSRSRGEGGADSDWDFLVLLDGEVDDERTDNIRHRLYEIEWESDEVISCVVRSRKEWNSPLYKAMPFHENVDREGIAL